MIARFAFLLFTLALFSTRFYGQENDSDSLHYEPIDTNRTHSIGFGLGGGVTLPIINPLQSTGFSDWKAYSNPYYSIGLWLKFPHEKMAYETGFVIESSWIKLSFSESSTEKVEKMTWSNISIPFLISTYDKSAKRKPYFSSGLLANLDITKQLDKDSRTFSLKNFSGGIAVKSGYSIKSLTAVYDAAIYIQYFPINFLKENHNNYNLALNNLTILKAGIQFTIR